MPFLSKLNVTLLTDSGGPSWVLDAPLIYKSDAAGREITVPAGFVTDFASVPRIPVAYMLTGDTAHAPAVVHDWLYSTHAVSRKTADDVFLEAMQQTGVPWWRRTIMYMAVRAFGSGIYDGKPVAQAGGDNAVS